MQCSDCGKGSFVTIGASKYCANCGAPSPVTKAAQKRPTKPLHAVAPARGARAAGDLHGGQTIAKPGVLDLRAKASAEHPRRSPAISRFARQGGALDLRAKPAATAAAPQPARGQQLATEPPAPVIDSAAATHINKMVAEAQRIQAEDKAKANAKKRPRSKTLASAIDAARTPQPVRTVTVVGIGAALALMAGFVWLQNSPKLAFHQAALEAGLEASLPNYLPASYGNQSKPEVKPGQITLKYNAPGATKPLVITEKKTDWDSNSLRDNYVSRQTDSYLAIPGQGLTIYTYNGGTATWVNHGVWYTVEGVSSLGREELLKIAYGL